MTLRVASYALMAALVLLGAVLIFDGTRRRPLQGGVPAAMVQGQGTGLTTGNAVSEQTPEGEAASALPRPSSAPVIEDTSSDTVVARIPALPTSRRLPGELQLSDVARISGVGNQSVLVFRDGSRLTVTPEVRRQLPGDLQLRLGYARDD